MIDSDLPLLPSLLDRLMDDQPEQRHDAPRNRAQNLNALENAIRRDLESLLNTRRCCISPLPEFTDLRTSLVEYGVPDFLSANAASDKIREELRAQVEDAIRRFETRFQTVSVTLVDRGAEIDRTLKFRIAALMYAEPAPEYVSFDSSLNPGSRTFSVSGRRDG
jgi:type VI secretion system protein ImpF